MTALRHSWILAAIFLLIHISPFAQVATLPNYQDTTVATVINCKAGTKIHPYAMYEFYVNGIRYISKGKTYKDLSRGEQFIIVYDKFNPYNNLILHTTPIFGLRDSQQKTKGVIFKRKQNFVWFIYIVMDKEGNANVLEKKQLIDLNKVKDPDKYFEKGAEYMVCYSTNDPSRAIIYFDSKIEANNTTAQIYYGKGIHALNSYRYKSALLLFNKAIQTDDNFSNAYYMRGLVNNKLNDASHAFDDFSEVLDRNPAFWEAHYQKGLLYLKNEDYDSALQEFHQAESLNPYKNDIIYVSLGEAYYLKGMYNESEKAFTEAIAINPTDSVNYYNRALAKIKISGCIEAGQTDLLDSEHNGFKKAGRVLRSNNTNHSLVSSQGSSSKIYVVYFSEVSRYPYHSNAGAFSLSYQYDITNLTNNSTSVGTFSTSDIIKKQDRITLIDYLNFEVGSYSGVYGDFKIGTTLGSTSTALDFGSGYNFCIKRIPQQIIRLGADFSYIHQSQEIGTIDNVNKNLQINNNDFTYITYTRGYHNAIVSDTQNTTHVFFTHTVFSIKPKIEFWLFPRDRFSLRFTFGYNIALKEVNSIKFSQKTQDGGNSTTVNINDPDLNFKTQNSVPLQSFITNNGFFFSIGGTIRLNQ